MVIPSIVVLARRGLLKHENLVEPEPDIEWRVNETLAVPVLTITGRVSSSSTEMREKPITIHLLTLTSQFLRLD